MAMPVQFVVGFTVVPMQMAMVVRRQLRAERPDLVGMLVGVSTEYGRVYFVSVHAHIRFVATHLRFTTQVAAKLSLVHSTHRRYPSSPSRR